MFKLLRTETHWCINWRAERVKLFVHGDVRDKRECLEVGGIFIGSRKKY